MRDAGAKINYAIVNKYQPRPGCFFSFFFKEFARMAQHVRFVAANIFIPNKHAATGIIVVIVVHHLY